MYTLPLTTAFKVEYDDPDEQQHPYWSYWCRDYAVHCVPCSSGYDVELYDADGKLVGSECTKLSAEELNQMTSVKLWELKRRLYTKLLYEWSEKPTEH